MGCLEVRIRRLVWFQLSFIFSSAQVLTENRYDCVRGEEEA